MWQQETEVLFHADDLPTTDPNGYRVLCDYAQRARIELRSRTDFVEQYLWRYCYRRVGKTKRYYATAALVFFNAPFDLSRLAIDVGPARGGTAGMAGGFSLRLWPLVVHPGTGEPAENRYRPRVQVKHLDSKKAVIRFGGVVGEPPLDSAEREPVTAAHHGYFLDLRTLIWALTNEAVSLKRGCAMFNVEHGKDDAERHGVITSDYVDYNRRDVLATAELAANVLTEFFRHPVDLQPTKAYSPASLAKAYLRTMGITPMLDRPGIPTDPVLLGRVTSTFYGGRAECHIRHTPVPVSVCDFTSMYPTVDILMGLWDLLIVDRVGVVDCTEDLCRFLDTLAVEDCLNPDLWPSFVGVVQIESDGDILPVRADYSGQPGTYNVGVNPLFSPRPLWFTIPDIVASTLLTGKPPMIRRALRFTPAGGKLPTLNGTALSGAVHVNPASHDFFRTVVERRADLKAETKGHPDTCPCERCRTHRFLKVLANAGSYGIFVEMLREETDRQAMTVWGAWDDPWTTTVTGRETVREFCYPPIGTVITGAARLMLALLERLVTEAGGSWAFCDTDSMAIVASKDGGLVPCQGGAERTADGQPAVRALTYAQVDEIRDTLNRLNPYDQSKVRDLMKREHDCWAYAISAKRYALFDYDYSGKPHVVADSETAIDRPADDDNPTIEEDAGLPVIGDEDKVSQHGLGLYLNPVDIASADRNWIRQTWQHLLNHAHGIRSEPPTWLTTPALTRTTVSSPHVLRPFADLNRDRAYVDRVKPFNFLLVVSELRPLGGNQPPRRLVTPYTTDPAAWFIQGWRDLHDPDGPPVRIVTHTASGDREVLVKSHRHVLGDYRTHTEDKALGPARQPCRPDTLGVLRRRPVRVRRCVHIGKETNRLSDAVAMTLRATEEALTDYGGDDFRRLVAAALAELSSRQVVGLLDADATRIRSQARQARSAAGHDARFTIAGYQQMTKAEQTAAKDAVQEAYAELRHQDR